MKTVYFKSGDVHLKYELEDEEHNLIIKSILDDEPDMEEMLDESLETLRDVSQLADDELDEDDEMDQTISVAFIWHYFNEVSPDPIGGDVAIIEDDDGNGVTVLPAREIVEE